MKIPFLEKIKFQEEKKGILVVVVLGTAKSGKSGKEPDFSGLGAVEKQVENVEGFSNLFRVKRFFTNCFSFSRQKL